MKKKKMKKNKVFCNIKENIIFYYKLYLDLMDSNFENFEKYRNK